MQKQSTRTDKRNNLFYYFVLSQLVFYITPGFSAPPVKIDYDISPALTAHTYALAAFIVGYIFNALLRSPTGKKQRSARQDRWAFRPEFFTAAYVMAAFGACVVVAQVGVLRSPSAYLSDLFSGSYNINIRNEYLTTSAEGGLSGALKMFGSVPLSIYLLSLSLPHFFEVSVEDRARFVRLNRFALVMTIIKVVFSLDRLTILAILLANLFITIKTRKRLGLKLFLFGLVMILAEFISRRRIETLGVLDFAVLYYNIGLANLQIMMNSLHGHSYGFQTILSPIGFIVHFFGVTGWEPVVTYETGWVTAQYLVAYAYEDFGALFPLFFLGLGFLFKTIDRKTLVQHNIYYSSIYFVVLLDTLSFIAVPAHQNVDFWIAILTPLALVRCFARKKKRRAIVRHLDMPFEVVETAPALTAAAT